MLATIRYLVHWTTAALLPSESSDALTNDFSDEDVGKTGRKKKEKENEKKKEKSSEKTRAIRFRKRRGESQSFLLSDADQESETRMSKNALRTGRRQAVDMMAFLLKQTKEVLLEVAIDLGVEVNSTLTKSEIKNRICQSEDYNEESVKSLLEGILAEKREARELKENRET
ncbi:hypothetical protein TNCV_1344891 [Trichonephila clavipes]|nr:hypothetical protein TNCV_1344891 [Trichonephila clavipes]